MQSNTRWNNNLAFLLAATGSAVGLGNIWGFPYKAGENGGGLFVLLYIFFVILLGLPVFMAEVAIGKIGKKDPVSAMINTAEKTNSTKNWRVVGYLGILSNLFIGGYYAVIAGLVINYGFISASGFIGKDPTVIYDTEISSFAEMTFWFLLFLALTGFVLARGIEKGIESSMRILMPTLFFLIILMVGYGAYRGDMSAALSYLFSWKAEQFSAATMQAAIGQAFFSLSIGMGTLMAFGYYMPKEQKVPGASSIVVTADTSVALLAGLAIFPLVFAFPFLDPNAGTELVFKTMSTAFAELGAIGQFVGPLFYLLLAVAALSSMISILEPSVLWVQERMPTTRTRATFIVIAICIVLCLISVSGFNVLKDFKVGSLENPFEMMKYIADDFLLLLGGTGISAFVGWRLSKIIDMEKLGFKSKLLFSARIFILRWVSPLFLMVIWVLGNLERIFFIKFF